MNHKTNLSKYGVLFGLVLLSACGGKEQNKSAGQVIAKVNGEEISIHQVNYVLARTNGINQDNLEAAKKQIANVLVDQTLLYQRAIADKLDRNPDIMMAIENAKRQLLAQSWLDKQTRNVNKPTAQEIEQYYLAHPELFAKHKTYKLKEVLIGKAADKQALIDQHLANSKQVDELLGKLESDKISHQINQTTQAAENLPLEQLPSLQGLKDGQYVSINKDNGTLVLAVLASIEEAVDKNKAAPIIETFLINQQRKTLVEQRLKEIKGAAKIEFTGEFAAQNSTAKAPKAAPAVNPPKTEDNDETISKGIKGL